MRTFAQKQNQSRRPVSSTLARPNIATFGQDHRRYPNLHLQRIIGNQAVQRTLRANAEEIEAGLNGTASPCFGHDFSRIPIHPPSAADPSRERGATPGATPPTEYTPDMVPEPETAKTCAGTALGTISPTVSANSSSGYVGADMSASVAPSATCPCSGFRWIQVAQILPPVTVGKGSNLFGLSDLPRPWVDGALGHGLPYHEVLGAIATTKISDTPSLARSHISTATPRISFLFNTACMCLRSGKKDQFIGLFSWEFNFGIHPQQDLLSGPTLYSTPTSFWERGVGIDFPTYSYVV